MSLRPLDLTALRGLYVPQARKAPAHGGVQKADEEINYFQGMTTVVSFGLPFNGPVKMGSSTVARK